MYHSNVFFWAMIDTFSSIYPPLPSIHVSCRLFHVWIDKKRKQKQIRTVVMIEKKKNQTPSHRCFIPESKSPFPHANPTQSHSQTPNQHVI